MRSTAIAYPHITRFSEAEAAASMTAAARRFADTLDSLDTPPGLTAPPGLASWNSSGDLPAYVMPMDMPAAKEPARVGHEGHLVRIRGMPLGLLTETMMEAVLEQAGLAEVMLSFHIARG